MEYRYRVERLDNCWRIVIPRHADDPEPVIMEGELLRLLADLEHFVAESNQAWLELAVKAGLVQP